MVAALLPYVPAHRHAHILHTLAETPAQVHTCTCTPRQVHIPACTCTHYTHTQCTLMHIFTVSHSHTHIHRLNHTLLHSSCFESWHPQLSLTLTQWCGVVSMGPGTLTLYLPSGPSLSCMSPGVKGEPQALGSGEQPVYTSDGVYWLDGGKKRMLSKSDEALDCALCSAPGGHPSSLWEPLRCTARTGATCKKCLRRRQRAEELGKAGRGSNHCTSPP